MTDFASVFAALRSIMLRHTQQLDCTVDNDQELYLNSKHIQKNGKPLFFGAVQIKKRHVSYHLMPVYLNPKLVEGISPELQKHMHGKSCFNFTTVDASLFRELAKLTKAGIMDYKKQRFVG
ncbi:MAG TPA: hypothetical protein PKD64_15130 [Pirellulaceae bacterium]|nr:hypothetical protein [Pirellulaceae bacterium]HMO93517.1 hypothetical protein [Pirellulaceae bacterium]HMP70422.1 hypothetical protein [Pirellulaceae bacterium]